MYSQTKTVEFLEWNSLYYNIFFNLNQKDVQKIMFLSKYSCFFVGCKFITKVSTKFRIKPIIFKPFVGTRFPLVNYKNIV